MNKKCNKIIIKSEDGFRDGKFYIDELVITDSHMSYKLQIHNKNKLLQDTCTEVYPYKIYMDPLFDFVNNNEFIIDEKYVVKFGEYISLTFYFDDGTEKEIHAYYEDISYVSNELFKFLRLLDRALEGTFVHPGYLYFEPEYDRY